MNLPSEFATRARVAAELVAAREAEEKARALELQEAEERRNAIRRPLAQEFGKDLPRPIGRVNWSEARGYLLQVHEETPGAWVLMYENAPTLNPAQNVRANRIPALRNLEVEVYDRLAAPRMDGEHPGYEIWVRIAPTTEGVEQ